jgi:hypothetical protein
VTKTPKKRGRGRPPLPKAKKAAPVSIYLTPGEQADLRAFAAAEKRRSGTHTTPSDVVRAMLRRDRRLQLWRKSRETK